MIAPERNAAPPMVDPFPPPVATPTLQVDAHRLAAPAEAFAPTGSVVDTSAADEVPFQKRSTGTVVAIAVGVLLVAAGGVGLAFNASKSTRHSAPHAAAAPSTPASAIASGLPRPESTVAPTQPTAAAATPSTPVASAATPSSAVASAASAPEAAPKPASTTGLLMTKGSAPGRRIFVDKRTVGQTPASITVSCGTHTVQLGSSGRPREIEVPCGGEISINGR